MAKPQTKRRRKRHSPGNAYAGGVRPTGIFSLFGNVRLFYIMGAALMLGSLGVGGLYGASAFHGGGGVNHQGFVLPDDDQPIGLPTAENDPGGSAVVHQYASPPPLTIDPAERYVATLMTVRGDIQVELFADRAPQTVNNFVFLARDGFYDGLPFHFVFPGFSAQTGDPTGTGRGGPGYELAQERPGRFEPGFLGMANASQFFIALDDSEQFDRYTPFGRVIAGLDVAERLALGDVVQSVTVGEAMMDAEPAGQDGAS